MEIRPIRPEECGPAGEVTVAAYWDVHDPKDMVEYEHELRDVAARLMDAEVLVAVDEDGAVLGCVTYVPGPESSLADSCIPRTP